MELLDRIDPGLRSGALSIVRRLQEHGYQALFAGGVVRDLLLGRRVSDVDIATSAPPEEVQNLFEHTVDVGKEFGVVIVVIDSTPFEVTTFRKDVEYIDGRHPVRVTFSDDREDALRRDFTVNALFLQPDTGQVVDYVDGRKDLDLHLIRTVGPAADRFEEDKLRVLRAIRFACQLDFRIEERTMAALREFAPKIRQVSWERIRDELIKILCSPGASRGLGLLLETGILEVILPEVAAMDGVEQPPEFHPEGDVFTHTRLMFELSEERSETLALGILLHDVGKPPTFAVRDRIRFDGHAEVGAEIAAEICRRLRISRETTKRVVALVKNHLRFIPVQQMRESTLKRFLRQEHFDEHLELHRLDCLASHGDLSNYYFCLEKLKEFEGEKMRPPRLITGNDLIEMGLQPGPLFSDILSKVEDLQLEGELESREQALDWVRKNYLSSTGLSGEELN